MRAPSAATTVPADAPGDARSLRVLLVSTFAFLICFAIWMMFGVIGIPIRRELDLNASEFGLLTATPVLTGAVFRLPLGIWTDRIGGRIVMVLLLVACAVPLWFASYATALWQFLLLGLALGLVGASFSVGTPYVARFFPKERRGFAMGVFGAGTAGAAINMFVAPVLVTHFGWQSVPRVYAVVLLITAAVFWSFSAPDTSAPGKAVPIRQQLAVLRDRRVWKYCEYYSIVFGGFTALSIWMPQYYVAEYGFSISQASLLAACFSQPGGALRGRRLAVRPLRRAQRHLVGALGRLDQPVPALLSADRADDPHRARPGGLPYWPAGLDGDRAAARARHLLRLRHGVHVQVHGDDFPQNMGVVSGIVGMAGGLGGFLLPILFGLLLDRLGVNSSCFMLLYGIVWVSLVLIYVSEVRRLPLMSTSSPASSAAQG